MHNGHKIQLGDLSHQIDYRRASSCVRVLRGRLLVEMLPAPTERMGLALPPSVAGALRPDVGVVIDAPGVWMLNSFVPGCVRTKGRAIDYPAPGTLVAVRPEDGVWLDEADLGDYRTDNQVRVYGAYCVNRGEPLPCDWWESVVAVLENTMPITIRPTGDNVLLRLDPLQDSERGILLPDSAKPRSGMATVVAVGPLSSDLAAGDRVGYDPRMLAKDALKFDLGDDGTDDLALCSPLALTHVLNVGDSAQEVVSA